MAFFDGFKNIFGKKAVPAEPAPAEAPAESPAAPSAEPAGTPFSSETDTAAEIPTPASAPAPIPPEENPEQVLPLFLSEEAQPAPLDSGAPAGSPEVPPPAATERPKKKPGTVKPGISSVSDSDDMGAFDAPGLIHAERAGTIDLEGLELTGTLAGSAPEPEAPEAVGSSEQNLRLDFSAPAVADGGEEPPVVQEPVEPESWTPADSPAAGEEPSASDTATPADTESESEQLESDAGEEIPDDSGEPEALPEPLSPQAKITPMADLVKPAAAPGKARPRPEGREKRPGAGKGRGRAGRRAKSAPEPEWPRDRAYRAQREDPERSARSADRYDDPRRAVAQAPLQPRRSPVWFWLGLFLAAVIGLGLGAAGTAYWYENGPQKNKVAEERAKGEKIIAGLKADLENERTAQMNVRTGEKRLFELLNSVHQDWDRLPAKPDYFRPNKGVVVFWVDGLVWRQYYVYQGKGADGPMTRVNATPDKRNFIYLKNLPKGLWRFSISALTQEGKETARSEELVIKSP